MHTRLLLLFLALTTAMVLGLPGVARANGYAAYAPALAWSPDGEWLAAAVGASWPQADSWPGGELRLYDRYGRYQVLASGTVGSPCFSADGALCAVVNGDAWRFPLAYGRSASQWVGEPVQLTSRGDVLDCRYGVRPGGGDELLYVTAGERFYGCGIYVLGAPSTELVPLYELGAEASAFAPVPSPQGQLCFLQQPGPNNGAYERLLWALPGEGSAAQAARPLQLLDDYHESNALWLDATHILFQRGGWGDWLLKRIDLETQNEVIEANDAESPSLSADCRFLVFARRDPAAKAQAEYDWELPCGIYVRDRTDGREQRLSLPGTDTACPALSPDGWRVAFLQGGPGGVRVIVRSNPLAVK